MTRAPAWKRHQWQMTKAAPGAGIICSRCGATLHSFDDIFEAELDEACEGFRQIDEAKAGSRRSA